MKNFLNLFFSFVLTLFLSACLENKQESNTSSIEERVNPGGIEPDSKHEIEHFDIEEVAQIYYEQIVPINHLVDDRPDSGLLPPAHQPRLEKIRSLLKGLLEGPCPKNANHIFDRLIEGVKKRIDVISDLLLKSTDPQIIEKLQERIEKLEELEKKLIEKKDDCLNGNAQCSEQFKQKIEDAIARIDTVIAELDQKIAEEQDDKRKDHLEKLLKRAQNDKSRLQDVLSKC